MERTLTYEEKIRRAEEIYARRNKNNVGNITKVPIRENKKKSVLKKMILQMLVCLGMYSIFYLINTTDYAFSEGVTENARGVLSYDVDLVKIYQDITQYFQSIINEPEQENFPKEIENQQEPNKEEGQEQTSSIEETNQEENTEIVEQVQEETEPLSQMEIDANEVKQKYSLISPLTGIVSSEFGEREVNNDLITPEHYGIDIAADEGAGIVSAMEGEVVTATFSSSYRKFYKNSKG